MRPALFLHLLFLVRPGCCLALLWFLVALPASVNAQVMPLEPSMFEKDTRHHATVWIDRDRTLTYPQALKKLKAREFVVLDSLDLPGVFGRGAFVYWIAVVVRNPTRTTFPLLLQSVRLSEDSTWHLRRGGTTHIKTLSKYGEEDPYGIIPYRLRWTWIYPVAPQATDTILVKYYNYKPKANFLPDVSDARAYAARSQLRSVQKNWYFIFGFGALFSVFVFAFSIWLYAREASFFWYAAFCLSLLMISFWNFDVEIPALYLLSNYIEWTYTKLYIHTLLPAVCHALFLYYFFQNQSPLLTKVVRWVLWTCAGAAAIETVFLAIDQLHWSWVFYWWFRLSIVMFGLVILYSIRKIPGIESKWIIRGALGIYLFDVLSNLLPQYSSQVTLIGLFIDIFCFTVATVSRFNRIQVEKYELLMAQQAREIEQKAEMERVRISVSQAIRNDIASDLHDDIGTALSSISFLGEMAANRLRQKNKPVGPILERIISQSRETVQTMRGALWVIDPQSDSLLDFCEKIRSFADVVLQSRQIHLLFQVTNPAYDCTLSLEIQRNLFLICKETVVNIARHAGATQASIQIQANPTCIELTISDNGSGFDKNQPAEGNGLRNMTYRAGQINGQLSLNSTPGTGTSLMLRVPLSTP